MHVTLFDCLQHAAVQIDVLQGDQDFNSSVQAHLVLIMVIKALILGSDR
jgi:hypothetical protein